MLGICCLMQSFLFLKNLLIYNVQMRQLETSLNNEHIILHGAYKPLKGDVSIMENVTTVKISIIGAVGLVGSIIINALGGWDAALRALILFMAVDYITGLIVAGVFKKSGKSETGALESRAGFKGLFRKGMILGIVFIATQLDMLSDTEIIRDTVIIGYIANEAVSIIENAGLMGVPIPAVIVKAVELLKKKKDDM